ncbi:MAG: universal stress protein [Nitrospira sp.]
MRVVIGVDWSDQAFAAVTQTFQLYHPTDVTLVHGIDLGILAHPVIAQAGDVQGYDDYRSAMVESGRQLLDRAADMIPPDIELIRKVNEVGSPAQLVLDSADNLSADLIVVGVRGRSRLSEVVLGSVSHRVLMHGSRPILIVRGAARKVKRALVAIEDRDDAGRIVKWLTHRPFAGPTELCVLHALVPVGVSDPYDALGTGTWWEGAERYADELVKIGRRQTLERPLYNHHESRHGQSRSGDRGGGEGYGPGGRGIPWTEGDFTFPLRKRLPHRRASRHLSGTGPAVNGSKPKQYWFSREYSFRCDGCCFYLSF